MFMKNKLNVAITGTTSGIGRQIAIILSKREDINLILIGRRKDRLESLAEELGRQSIAVPLDITDREAVKKSFESLPKDFIDIDVLVNNAGLSLGFAPAYNCELDDWEAIVDTNIKGLLYCTQAVLPKMVKRNSGHIINISSISASYPYHGGNVYAASKAFVHQLSLNLRSDLQGKAVKVSCILPGMSKTEFATVRYKGDIEKANSVYRGKKPLSPKDIAEAVLWCIQQPSHVNINSIEIVALDQPFSLGFNAPIVSLNNLQKDRLNLKLENKEKSLSRY